MTELEPGQRYRVKFSDCCLGGHFTGVYIGPCGSGHRFDTGYIEAEPSQIGFERDIEHEEAAA